MSAQARKIAEPRGDLAMPKARTGRNGLLDREPPHSVDAEQGVLGSMLQPRGGSEAIAEATAKIGAEHFFVPAHRTIFTAICDLWDAGQAIDLITFTQSLRDKKLLDAVGGAAFVTSLFTFVPMAANVAYYIDIVRDKYILRSIVHAATESVRRACEEPDEPETLLDEIECRIDLLRSIHGRNGSDLPAATNLIVLAETDPAIFEADNLLGTRFLCIEGGMLFIAPSGTGKSSASVQQDICWSLGRPAFGIKPPRPMRILSLNAENDDGDLAEMTRGICDHLNLTDEERKLVAERVVYIKEKKLTGKAFLRELRRLARKYKPDIIRIDPMHAYAGGDVKDPAITTPFLRSGLNPILEEFRCAAIVVHHTPKTTYRDTSEWNATDWMYAGAGNADVTNWARAILVIDATRVPGTFMFRAAKRGSRIGWADDDGHRVYERLFCHHAGDAIFWREATDDDMERVAQAKAKRGEPLKTKGELKALVPLDEDIPKQALLHRANIKGFGLNYAKRLLADLIADDELHELRRPRKGTCPEVWISRREQVLI
jgi:hypothetical protein